MSDAIRPQPGVLDIALYEGGKANVAGVANAVKLSSNENSFGPSDKAKDAFQRSMHSLRRYPDTDHANLRHAIGEVHDLDPASGTRSKVAPTARLLILRRLCAFLSSGGPIGHDQPCHSRVT